MRIAVAGGTGVAGARTVQALGTGGHEAVVLARSTGVDIATGAGLTAALEGVDAVVDATSIQTVSARRASAFFESTARNLARAAREAGVPHLVALSIIGIDRVPGGYYEGKLRQEEVLGESDVPVSIVRATQFHEFAAQYLDRVRGRLVVVPRWPVQPVAAAEVGRLLARVATGAPVGRVELAGPRVERMADMVRQVADRRAPRRRVVELRIPGRAGRAMARGGNLPLTDGELGRQTFADWLRSTDRSD